MVRSERETEVEDLAHEKVDERLLDLLLPLPAELRPAEPAAAPVAGRAGVAAHAGATHTAGANVFVVSPAGAVTQEHGDGNGAHAPANGASNGANGTNGALHGGHAEGRDERRSAERDRYQRTRDKLKLLLVDGQLEQREVEIEVTQQSSHLFDLMASRGEADGNDNLADLLREMMPKRKKKRTVKVAEARRILLDEELEKLIDLEDVTADALERVENLGIVFLDEIDKIAGARGEAHHGPDVSREGVQRDLLPIVEGSNVPTKYGIVKTDHILFIAAGAFHVAKPSDLIPELQGRFPIRVELKPLTEGDFVRIMTEPENALTKQYGALVQAESATLRFTDDGIAEIARVAAHVNERMENIGARRLHTVMTTLLEEVLYDLPDQRTEEIVVDAPMVRERLKAIVEDEDLRKYIL
jgi:ATP-dependent HslUV protease ATP-binding subunit HslU